MKVNTGRSVFSFSTPSTCLHCCREKILTSPFPRRHFSQIWYTVPQEETAKQTLVGNTRASRYVILSVCCWLTSSIICLLILFCLALFRREAVQGHLLGLLTPWVTSARDLPLSDSKWASNTGTYENKMNVFAICFCSSDEW